MDHLSFVGPLPSCARCTHGAKEWCRKHGEPTHPGFCCNQVQLRDPRCGDCAHFVLTRCSGGLNDNDSGDCRRACPARDGFPHVQVLQHGCGKFVPRYATLDMPKPSSNVPPPPRCDADEVALMTWRPTQRTPP